MNTKNAKIAKNIRITKNIRIQKSMGLTYKYIIIPDVLNNLFSKKTFLQYKILAKWIKMEYNNSSVKLQFFWCSSDVTARFFHNQK